METIFRYELSLNPLANRVDGARFASPNLADYGRPPLTPNQKGNAPFGSGKAAVTSERHNYDGSTADHLTGLDRHKDAAHSDFAQFYSASKEFPDKAHKHNNFVDQSISLTDLGDKQIRVA